MELAAFFRYLLRYKWVLFIVPLITACISFFLTQKLKNNYQSRARIATGIVNREDAILNINLPESKINQEFNNIIEMMVLKKNLMQVSYKLLQHDLQNKTPFRTPGKELKEMSKAEISEISSLLQQKIQKGEDLDLTNDSEFQLNDLLESLEYDYESIRNSLAVYRVNNSDFIDLQFESENPMISAFVLNTLCQEFIAYHTHTLNQNKDKTIAFLDSVITKKQDTLKKKMQALQAYKVRNGVLDVNDQASTLIAQIADFETKRQEARKNINAYRGAIQSINARFNPNDRKYYESVQAKLNQDIVQTRNRIAAANDEYIKSNFDSRLKTRMDSLQSSLSAKINQINDNQNYDPLASKKSLIEEKTNLELSLELAKNSVSSLDAELSRLNGKLYALVPDQAAVKNLQDEIEIYRKDYDALTNKYNQALLDANFTTRLVQVEKAMPGAKLPSKKLLLVILAGVISFTFCVVVLFLLFFFDNAVNNATTLANKTGLQVLGTLPYLKEKGLDFTTIWDKQPSNQTSVHKQFKKELRNIRFEIDQEGNNPKVLTITSLQPGAGKSFIAYNLAQAYKMANKNVLLIDGNFEAPELSKHTNTTFYFEDFITNSSKVAIMTNQPDVIPVLGNHGSDKSLAELASSDIIEQKVTMLKDQYDVIIIEAPSLDSLNMAREWMVRADSSVVVFESGEQMNESKLQVLESLKSENSTLLGWILNKDKNGKNSN